MERTAKGKQKEGGAERRERGGTRGNPSSSSASSALSASAPAAASAASSAVGRPVFDLLSIDVDYNDFWVWRAIIDAGWRPRVVVVEVNAKIPWPESITVTYNATAEWDGTEYVEESCVSIIYYTRYTPFIHLYSRIYTCIHPLYTIYTPNTPLNTPYSPYIRPIYTTPGTTGRVWRRCGGWGARRGI